MNRREFEVALSFPGEERRFVSKLAKHLADQLGEQRVLYDKFHMGRFAALDLDATLPNLYRTESELVVILLCPDYTKKRWCGLEWRAIKQIIATPEQKRILLLKRGDPGDLSALGIYQGDGWLETKGKTTGALAKIILDELARRTGWSRPRVDATVSVRRPPVLVLPEPEESDVKDRGWQLEPGVRRSVVGLSGLVSFSDLESVSCVVAIGEPGIGKSKGMQQEFQAARSRHAGEPSHFVFGRDLRVYRDEGRFVAEIFESEGWRKWSAGEAWLSLYLDSLDECRLGTPFVTDLLTHQLELNRRHLGKLRLRVACRTADLPRQIADTWCSDLFKSAGFQVVRVPPLSDSEVRTILVGTGVDADDLTRRVTALGAADLLRRPITLNMLAKAFQQEHPPTTLTAIYEQGCLALADEWSQARKDEARLMSGYLSAQAKLAIDTHAAALLILSNRRFMGDREFEHAEDSIPVADVATGAPVPAGATADRLGAVRDCLKMALFSMPDPTQDLTEFAHRTYCEFLASRHPNREALISLLKTDGESGARIVPQLAEVAAWLACNDEEFRRFVLSTQPQLLLSSDVVRSDELGKADVAEALIGAVDDKKVALNEVLYLDGFPDLKSDRVAGLVGCWIQDNNRTLEARLLACTIAHEAKLLATADGLYAVLADKDQDLRLRVAAARTIAGLGDVRVNRLRPFAEGLPEDANDEIKGYALSALFPADIPPTELFGYISPPKNDSFYGAYMAFLHGRMQSIDVALVVPGLRWCLGVNRSAHDFGAVIDLADAIVRKAWTSLADPEVVSLLAQLAVTWAGNYESILPVPAKSWVHITDQDAVGGELSDQARRAVIFDMLAHGRATRELWDNIVFSQHPLALGKDAAWLLGLKKQLPSEQHPIWATLTETLFRVPGQNYFDLVAEHLAEILDDLDLKCAFSKVLEPVALAGPEAASARAMLQSDAEWRRQSEIRKQEEDERKLKEDPRTRVLRFLEEAEGDQVNGWWKVWLQLTLTPDSTRYGNPLHTIVTAMPGWRDAGPDTRERLVALAARYLETGSPSFSEWFGKSTIHYPASAGYAAFGLLFEAASPQYQAIPSGIWQKWAKTIVAVPVDGEAERSLHAMLVADAYAEAPEEVLDTLLELILEENRTHGHIFSHTLVAACWDERIRLFFQNLLTTPEMKPTPVGIVAEVLLGRDDNASLGWACDTVSDENAPSDLRIAVARALMTKAHGASWGRLAPILWADHDLARSVFSAVANSAGFLRAWPEQVDVARDGAVLTLMIQVFPYANDVRPLGAHTVGLQEQAQEIRDSLLRRIAGLGTHAAADFMSQLAVEHPDLHWLRDRALEARTLAERKSWSPKSPKEVAAILANRNRQ